MSVVITGCLSLEVKPVVELRGLEVANISTGSAVDAGPKFAAGFSFF